MLFMQSFCPFTSAFTGPSKFWAEKWQCLIVIIVSVIAIGTYVMFVYTVQLNSNLTLAHM